MKRFLIKYRLFFLWIAGCVIVLTRREVWINFQFWADDSFTFFRESLDLGWKSFVTPWAGYLHLVPRTVTYSAVSISDVFGQGVYWVPAIMNYCAVALNSICAVTVCSSRFKWFGNIYFRVLLSLFILTFPDANEVCGNATNIHWWLGILEFFLLWDLFRKKKMPGWFDTIILSAIMLSSPIGLIAFPAGIACYCYADKKQPVRDFSKIILFFILSAVQLMLILQNRISHDENLLMHLSNVIDFVFVQLFAHLLVGNTSPYAGLFVIGFLFFVITVLFLRKSFKKLYAPLAFLLMAGGITVFGADLEGFKYGRYIFIPVVVIVSIIVYGFNQLLQQKESKCKILNISFFCFVFLLISIRIVRNYKIPLIDYPWKEEASLYDSQGTDLYHFPVNPFIWSVGILSSQSREDYLPKSLNKIEMTNDLIISARDISVRGNVFTVTGSSPELIYRLPEATVISYSCMDFEFSAGTIEKITLSFFSENDERHDMLFYVKENNLMCLDKFMQSLKAKQVRLVFSSKASYFIFKQFNVYALPYENR